MPIGGTKFTLAIGAVSVLALAAGCTTTQSQYSQRATYGAPHAGAVSYTGPDRIFRDGYVENMRPRTTYARLENDPLIYRRFEGVEGARRAHAIYASEQAERLDGACQSRVQLNPGETLYDIEQLCDVSISSLFDLNPGIRHARAVSAGQVINIPQIYNAERHALAAAAEISLSGLQHASVYVVQPGDTLNDIAAKHLVSSTQVARANPGVHWASLPVGAQVRIPAASPTGHYAPAQAPIVPSALPYAYGAASDYSPGGPGRHSGATGTSVDPSVTAVMPYQMTPAQKAAEQSSIAKPMLTISARTVNPGGDVTVRGSQLPPNSNVLLYSGPNGRELKYVGLVRTDARGDFAETVKVDVENAGGLIFRAVDESGKQHQSPRLGVDVIDAPEEY